MKPGTYTPAQLAAEMEKDGVKDVVVHRRPRASPFAWSTVLGLVGFGCIALALYLDDYQPDPPATTLQ